MENPVLLSIIESPTHPNFSSLYRRLNLREVKATSMRKAIAEAKKHRPGFVVAEFFYGFGNNYAGANISNLDVFLSSLQKYAPGARVLVIVDKAELRYVEGLTDRFELHAVLAHPVEEEQMREALEA